MKTSLAPMEGVTNFPMRLWIMWASSPAHMTTPFLRVNRVQPERQLPLLFAPELFELRGLLPYELTPQFLSADTDGFVRAAHFLDGIKVPAIELNCGCPCPTCIGKNAGSGILAEPDVFEATIDHLQNEIGPRRLAVKMRLGYHHDDEFDDLLSRVAKKSLARLTVHGRTRADGYKGEARWSAIAKAAALSDAPTWGSGDVVCHETFAKAIDVAPAIDGIVIGRGAIRNPWIFEEVRLGRPVDVDVSALANALLAFLFVNELSITAPEKLVAKLAHGRLPLRCGTDAQAWESLTATLSSLTIGVPMVWAGTQTFDDVRLSPTTMTRLRYLWSCMRLGLPETFSSPKLLRAKTVAQFFGEFRSKLS